MTTKKEQEWYKQFWEGTFLAKGWISRETELLENFEGSEREHMASSLNDTGNYDFGMI
jgi:hypothetical protein